MKNKKYLLFLALVMSALAACGLPRITNEAGVQSTSVPTTFAPTATPLPGFTKTLTDGESILANNGINRAIEATFKNEEWTCNDGTTTSCVVSLGNAEFDFVVDGIIIGHATGATIEIFPGWGLTPGQE